MFAIAALAGLTGRLYVGLARIWGVNVNNELDRFLLLSNLSNLSLLFVAPLFLCMAMILLLVLKKGPGVESFIRDFRADVMRTLKMRGWKHAVAATWIFQSAIMIFLPWFGWRFCNAGYDTAWQNNVWATARGIGMIVIGCYFLFLGTCIARETIKSTQAFYRTRGRESWQ